MNKTRLLRKRELLYKFIKRKPVVGARDNSLRVEANAPDQLFVALKHAEAGANFDIPDAKNVAVIFHFSSKTLENIIVEN